MYKDNKRRILAVDDDPLMRMLLRLLINRFGCVPKLAASFRDAMTQLGEGEYSMIFLDGHLPDGMGTDLARYVRKDLGWHEIPIIAVSSDNSEAHIEKMYEAGVTAFVSKPVDGDDILRLLENYLGVQRADAAG